MKKLFLWLLAGLVAIAVSISFKSNIWVLMSMVSLLMTPLFFITLRLVKRNYAQSLEAEKRLSVVSVSTEDPNTAYELSRRERMRSEANELQAELRRINEIEDTFTKIERMSKWKMKSLTHQQLYNDFYDSMPDYKNDVEFKVRLLDPNKD